MKQALIKTQIKSQLKTAIMILSLLVISLVTLTGCDNNSPSKKSSDEKHTIITVKQGEDIVINPDEITSSATYYNYEIDGYIIQVFAVKATDGTVRVVFNTCGACNPSPMAYFVQDGDYFECQNCGNRFHRDNIGLKKTVGCSPIAILDENKTIDGNNIVISSSFIETYKDKFEPINIYKN